MFSVTSCTLTVALSLSSLLAIRLLILFRMLVTFRLEALTERTLQNEVNIRQNVRRGNLFLIRKYPKAMPASTTVSMMTMRDMINDV